MGCLLAIDQSTSASKVVLFDTAGLVLDKESVEHEQFYPQSGWVEHDAQEIWENILDAAAEVLSRNASHRGLIRAVSLTNQRETVVAFDKARGTPRHRAIVWQCRRGELLCQRQRALGREQLMRSRTGLRIDGYFSASKLQWLLLEQRQIAGEVLAGRTLIGTMDTYLIYRLTRGEVFATDPTNASRTLLFEIEALQWDAELCAAWEIPIKVLAEVRACDAHFGSTTIGGLLPHRVPVCGVMGDSQAALFGHGCLREGTAKVTLGTGSSVLFNAGNAVPAELQGAVGALAWVRQGKPTYALEGIINSAAASLNWLRDQLGLTLRLDEIDLAVGTRNPEQDVFLVPAFSGLGAPYWRSTARAAIVGLSTHHESKDVVRAALEAIAYQVRDVFEMMQRECGIRPSLIHCDGGPTTNLQLMQFIADITGLDLTVSANPDCSAWGASLMGALALDLIPGGGCALGSATTDASFTRHCNPAQAELRYERWQGAVKQVLCAP